MHGQPHGLLGIGEVSNSGNPVAASRLGLRVKHRVGDTRLFAAVLQLRFSARGLVVGWLGLPQSQWL